MFQSCFLNSEGFHINRVFNFFFVRSKVVFIIFCILMLSACSSMEAVLKVPTETSSLGVEEFDIQTSKRSIHLFSPARLDREAKEQLLEKRVDNLFVILDINESKTTYRDIPINIYAREIFRRFNRTIPHTKLFGGVWRLGTELPVLRIRPYQPTVIENELDIGETLPSIGSTDLAEAIDNIAKISNQHPGKNALLLVTSWSQIDDDVVDSVKRFRQYGEANAGFSVIPAKSNWNSHGSGNCVFTIGIGNSLSRSRLDEADLCGTSVAGDKIAQPRDMEAFVRKMFYLAPRDTDGDGIFDYVDECPHTELGRVVSRRGCPRFAEAEEAKR